MKDDREAALSDLQQGREAASAGRVADAVAAFNRVFKSGVAVGSMEPEIRLQPVFERLQFFQEAAQCGYRIQGSGLNDLEVYRDPAQIRWREQLQSTNDVDLMAALESD